jgi:CheY-like chemotaxis protein
MEVGTPASGRAPRDHVAGIKVGGSEPEARRTAAPRASVLVVDDVAANLTAVEAVLEPLLCHVVRAHSGKEALDRVLFHDFAVLLIDVMMPGLDGLATAGHIKSRPATRHIPIIFLTARDTKALEIAQAYAHGAVDYLIKPVDPDILRSKVAFFVELFRHREELKAQTELAQQREQEAAENRRLYERERGARAQAEAIARAREDIIAVVSHDLRNPMSAIAANASIMRMRLAKNSGEDLATCVDAVERNVTRMERLVSDLLDTARIQSGGLAPAVWQFSCARKA